MSVARGRRRRICVVTGTRAEYGLMRTTLRAIRRHPRLDLQLLVTGMHRLRAFGRTIDEIRRDGWRIAAEVPMQSGRDDAFAEARALGRGIAGIGAALERLRSDVVLVVGDRIEAFAAAAATTAARRVLAHVHGGDRATGDVDDSLRHAITKLAHVHLVASTDAQKRVRRLGEEPRRIFRVGAPGLDDVRALRRPSRAWIARTLGWERVPPYAVVLQHPCGRSAAIERRDMEATLRAVADAGLAVVILHPNSDPGHSGIIDAIRVWTGRERFASVAESRRPAPGRAGGADLCFVARSLERDAFVRLLKGAAVLVGNSSCGIIESAAAGVPAVNIGPRQTGRLRCGPGVIDCAYGSAAVLRAVRRALRVRVRSDKSAYGDGRAGVRIAAVLAQVPLDGAFRQKLIAY